MTCLANRFAKAGDEVALLTTTFGEHEYFVDDKVTRFAICEDGEKGNIITKNLYQLKRIRAICKEYNPDVAVSFMKRPNFRLIVSTVGMKFKKIVSVRCDPPHEYTNLVERVLAKTFYRFVDGIVFQTKEARDWFSKPIRNKSDIIFNQVDERFFDVKFEGERRDIVTTGRLSTIKNHAMLIDAFSKIASKTDHNVIIYGEGPLRDSLESQIKSLGLCDRVFVPGSVSDVIGAVSGAKLFVLSSDYEGMPNALLEALAMGVPSISTDCAGGGPRAIINDGDNALLIPVGNAEILAQKMLWALEHSDNMERMGKNAAVTAQSFHPEKVYVSWRNYLEQVCNK